MSPLCSEHPMCAQCKRALSRINGRTLRLSPVRRSGIRRGRDEKRWIHVCPTCEGGHLLDANGTSLPFQAPDGVMRTVTDPDGEARLDFVGFAFTTRALASAADLSAREDANGTANVEQLAREYRHSASPVTALKLTEAVCAWGGGGRVLGNLKRHHGRDLGLLSHDWMQTALTANTDEEAVAPRSPTGPGAPKGLGVSFASKHLRMLDPHRFAVLDSVLSQGLGFALNPKGYALFMTHLRRFHATVPGNWSSKHALARTEAGIFMLVRQHVRATADPLHA